MNDLEKYEEELKKLKFAAREDLLKRSLSNTENFDKSILSLSSAGLGLSLTFIKNVNESNFEWALILSWCLFGIAILVTIISFLVSNCGINKQLDIVDKYYSPGSSADVDDEEYKNKFIFVVRCISYVAGVCFILAIALTIFFVSFNLGNKMASTKKTNVQTGQSKTRADGADIPALQLKPAQQASQKQSEKKGASIPELQEKPKKPGNKD